MALPLYDHPQARPALALVPNGPPTRRRLPVTPRRPASVYWFRRTLIAALFLLALWASSLLAAEFGWALSPENPAGHVQPQPGYVVVGDTALPVSPDGR